MLDLVGTVDYTTQNYDRFTNSTEKRSQYTTVLRRPNTVEVSPSYRSTYHDTENNETTNELCYVKYNNAYHSKNSVCTDEDATIVAAKKNMVTVHAVQKCITLPSHPRVEEQTKKTFSCPKCDKVFTRRGSLNSHMTTHTNKRPHKCDTCPKIDLTTHKKTHNGKYKCLYCSKKFSVPSKLERHVRIHLNQRPYVCDFPDCARAFTDKRNLMSHKITHLPEKKFKCTICTKAFKSTTRLKQHLKCHISGVMYSCGLC
ncbi:hypothetical protein NQ317_014676 [Molorchus minor]|uniref:C2H2-type domain-containing protein n=1 Tax=Molorchus minor TaxID=1323400 RepID=A0ABQ9IXV4_9CUCU|nr:hypothetical protein NQ317_014676 [Molorchus minor]